MKKALTLVVLIVTPSIIFAQGSVTFQNSTGLVRDWSGTPVPAGDAMVELIAAPVGTVLPSPTLSGYPTLAGFLAANPGWAVGTTHFPNVIGSNPGGLAAAGIFSNGDLQLDNVGGGANADYFVIGWTGPNGGPLGAATTYEAAYALGTCWFGESAIFTTGTGDPYAGGVPTLPVNLKFTFGGMIMGIPEPSTSALADLGLAALLVFRRRPMARIRAIAIISPSILSCLRIRAFFLARAFLCFTAWSLCLSRHATHIRSARFAPSSARASVI